MLPTKGAKEASFPVSTMFSSLFKSDLPLLPYIDKKLYFRSAKTKKMIDATKHASYYTVSSSTST